MIMQIVIITLIAILYNIIIGIWIGTLAEAKGHEFLRSFLISLFLGPIIGFLHLISLDLDKKNCSCKS